MKNRQYLNPLLDDNEVFSLLCKEREKIGFYNLPFSHSLDLKKELKEFTQKDIAIIGIGGSSLGTFAIYDFLDHSKNLEKKLHFFESTDPLSIQSKLKKIDVNNTLFVVISKSGTTLETISIFKYISSLVQIDKSNCLVITENDSKLNSFAKSNSIKSFEIPKNVGGRFSVLSNVGLIPLFLVGIDEKKLLSGAQDVANSFFEKGEFYDLLIQKAKFIAENKDKYNINAIFSYSEMLNGFNKWYIQLWGESLGKIDAKNINQGLTPIGLLGPVDQHSFLQLIVEGKRDKTVTFVKIKDFKENTKVPHNSLSSLEELDLINGLEFSTLINMQAEATIQSVKELKDIPVDIIEIQEVSEYSIGRLMYYFELLTALVAKFLQIDAYGQPGVEYGKKILKDKLERV